MNASVTAKDMAGAVRQVDWMGAVRTARAAAHAEWAAAAVWEQLAVYTATVTSPRRAVSNLQGFTGIPAGRAALWRTGQLPTDVQDVDAAQTAGTITDLRRQIGLPPVDHAGLDPAAWLAAACTDDLVDPDLWAENLASRRPVTRSVLAELEALKLTKEAHRRYQLAIRTRRVTAGYAAELLTLLDVPRTRIGRVMGMTPDAVREMLRRNTFPPTFAGPPSARTVTGPGMRHLRMAGTTKQNTTGPVSGATGPAVAVLADLPDLPVSGPQRRADWRIARPIDLQPIGASS